MNRRTHAIRVGLQRGWTEFKLGIKSPQDQGFYVFTALIVLLYLYIRRDTDVAGTSLAFPVLALPSILGALVVFGLVIGPAYAIAMEREDGTLLRARAAPYGLNGYVSGIVLNHSLGLIPSFLVILVPSALLFGGLMQQGVEGWLTVAWVVVLALLAAMPIGIAIGSLVPGVQKVGIVGDASGPRAPRDLRHLHPDPGSLGVAPGRGAGVPDVLGRSRDAIRVPPRRCRGARDRRVVADARDRAGARRLGDSGAPRDAGAAAPDGSPPVRFAGRGRDARVDAVGQVSRW